MSVAARAKKWLFEHSPAVYRLTSLAYRSRRVIEGVAYLFENRHRLMMGERPILITYPGESSPRWTASHPALDRVLQLNRAHYHGLIDSFAAFRPAIEQIPSSAPPDSPEPSWTNSFFSGVDAFALYGMLATTRPGLYLEIGSGNSTKIARRAVRDHGLPTKVLSVDPAPRAEVDALCDEVVRQRLEDTNLEVIDRLQPGDILFFDGSHYAFMSSDVVVFFFEILPRLRPGVLVHIHDIFLPYDYPVTWAERYYSEQYLLAMALLSPTPFVDVIFPAAFVERDPELGQAIHQRWGPRAEGSGASFWLRTHGTYGR